jgi:Mce-associated membrane protein
MTAATVQDRPAQAELPSGQRRLPAPVPRVALVLSVIAAAVLAVVLGHQVTVQRAHAQDRADAVAAARQVAVNFSTLDYRTFDRDTARVSAETTGAFHTDFATQAAQIKQVVVSDKSVSSGQVGQVAVVSSTPTRARVLVVLDATVTNTSSPTPTARHYRVQLDLTKVHGRWLASQLQFVG